MNKGNLFLTGLLTGALAGLAIGILLAPKAGKEIREFIAKTADEIRERTGNYVDVVRDRFHGDGEEGTA